MRAGTQTLIQALQALPWTKDPDNDDEIMNHSGLTPVTDSESEEEDKTRPSPHLASSIHTIYRPLARSRKLSVGPGSQRRLGIPEYAELNDDEPVSSSLSDDEGSDDSADDFEVTTPRASDPKTPLASKASSRVGALGKATFSRTGSMATVRLQRRAMLAEKLRQIYELDGIEEVRAEMPCWLLRSILLQGYMYLTNTYLCFFAHMPSKEDQVLKSGSLSKKATRTKRWIKHWFVLKNDALSWYQSSSDPYFPHGIVDLRYAISCEPVGEKEFRVRTNQKTVLLYADSVPSREEWVKAIRKVIFKAQNMGDSVKIAIPYSAILDVDKSSAMDFSETIEIKVLDKEASGLLSVDSYFFAYFHDLPSALDQIREAVRTHRAATEYDDGSPKTVLDTTVTRAPLNSYPERTVSVPTAAEVSRDKASGSGFRIASLLRPFGDSRPQIMPASESAPDVMEEFTHISKRSSASFVPVTTTGSPLKQLDSHTSEEDEDLNLTPKPANQEYHHTYPPSTSLTPSLVPDQTSLTRRESNTSSGSSWNVGVPSWLKGARTTRFFTSSVSSALPTTPPAPVKEVYSSTSSVSGSKLSSMGDMAFSVLDTPEMAIDGDVVDKFRTSFAYDEKEMLLGYFPGYIFRLLPVFGRLYISTNYFCFKSSGPLTSRTRMTLPLRDILATEKSKATRFGHHGLIIIVRGHEELFFEFNAEDKRDTFVFLLEKQMEDVHKRLAAGDTNIPTQGKLDALVLEEFETRSPGGSQDDPIPTSESLTDSLPAVMFTSVSSTFLTFKPQKSLHFTFLTIGSRGDVQPYIALAKGLKADGHRVRIATHREFKDWIEAQDIEFGYVGGDPAELMRICVENGMFTLSFMKEGLQKFRGWLDDLLKTSWEACQGTDVLIESPSAMGGYHIAEALAIPYFRAFTMTWSRTRAYPHAFAVPERKMGGSYNYMSYVMFDQVFWRATSGQINRWRRNLLHLGATSLDKMEPHKIPFLYNFSPHVVPPPLDWPEWIRVTEMDSPPDLVAFIDNAHKLEKKVVYIGFGSIVVSDPRAMTRCVIEAVVQSGVHAILSKGWSDRLHVKTADASDSEEPLPKQIYSISSIPHDWLFRRIDAACHHGGAGTTGASLRSGIPTIIKPFFGDQFFWADRVEALGVGSGVRKLTIDSLTDALILATTDRKQIERAKLIGEQIRGEDGVATAVESIYRDLDYARSLIKRTISESEDEEEADTGQGTIRQHRRQSSGPVDPSSGSSSSGGGAPSEDWSVISEQDERRSSFGSRDSKSNSKRNSGFAAMLSVLPDAFIPGSPRRRTISINSQS
ncbi:hypothetical protein CPB85DRAFT_1465830 [Mucidula mucida]|nr:hypothetical protein CPB85DRAFT_1465830 [Mucidula mucida]